LPAKPTNWLGSCGGASNSEKLMQFLSETFDNSTLPAI
jgi:hypothetical protein